MCLVICITIGWIVVQANKFLVFRMIFNINTFTCDCEPRSHECIRLQIYKTTSDLVWWKWNQLVALATVFKPSHYRVSVTGEWCHDCIHPGHTTAWTTLKTYIFCLQFEGYHAGTNVTQPITHIHIFYNPFIYFVRHTLIHILYKQ